MFFADYIYDTIFQDVEMGTWMIVSEKYSAMLVDDLILTVQ